MKKYILILVMLTNLKAVYAQRTKILEQMKQELAASKEDTSKVNLYAYLSFYYSVYNTDSSRYYATLGLKLADKLEYAEGQCRLLYRLGEYYATAGDLPKGLQYIIQGRQIAAKIKSKREIGEGIFAIGSIYSDINAPEITNNDYLTARAMIQSKDRPMVDLINRIDLNLGASYMFQNKPDSAFIYLNGLYQRIKPDNFFYTPTLIFYGVLQFQMDHTNEAIKLLKLSGSIAENDNDRYTSIDANFYLASIYDKINMPDSAIAFAQKAFENAKLVNRKDMELSTANLLSKLYEPINLEKSYQYLIIARDVNNELYGTQKIQGLQKLFLDEQQNKFIAEQQQIEFKNKLRLYLVISGLVVLALIAFLLYRNNVRGKKLNYKLQSTLDHLKATQAQLIQSEKMASLGELTAGIAHEIQNPLNFVNNFSEVNKELVDELEQEAGKGNLEEIKAIAKDIKDNEEKIIHHGKRADAIVKGMLQHSMRGSGQKELTDINALCDEYLRLAFHGLRVKDKSFNAKYETNFDKGINKINIVPQDIGRVVLNLINNAFYAVNEKAKQNIDGYEPTVTVSTKKENGKIEISVKDNGNGIPDSIKEKIFQPFFTTKPTGQGTGLGLSLSYDIVKAHGGNIKVESKEREGTQFIILLPVV